MDAFVKGLTDEQIERVLTGGLGELGPFALPLAISIYNTEEILDELEKEKTRRAREKAQARADAAAVAAAGGIGAIAGGIRVGGGGFMGDRGTLGQAGGASQVEPRGAGGESKEPDTGLRGIEIIQPSPVVERGSLGQSGGRTVFEPPSSSSGLRKRAVGHAGVEEPSAGASQDAIQRGLRGGFEDVPLDEIVVEQPDISQGKERRQRTRLPRPTRRQIGVGGGIIATIGALWPGAKVIKKNVDGTVDVKDPQGNIHRINPSMFEKAARGMTEASSGVEFYIKNKYRTPRSGRWDSRLFKKYTDVGAQMANPGGINNNVGRSLDISSKIKKKRKDAGIQSTGRRIQLDDPPEERSRGLV